MIEAQQATADRKTRLTRWVAETKGRCEKSTATFAGITEQGFPGRRNRGNLAILHGCKANAYFPLGCGKT